MIYVSLMLIIAIICLIIYAAIILLKASSTFNKIQDFQSVQNEINNGILERVKVLEKALDEFKR